MNLRRYITAAAILTTLLPLLAFRAPANTVTAGDELAALSWVLAENRGEGNWSLYPMTITVKFNRNVTAVLIQNCGKTTPPGSRLPAEIPFPVNYTQSENNVSITFNEVPVHE